MIIVKPSAGRLSLRRRVRRWLRGRYLHWLRVHRPQEYREWAGVAWRSSLDRHVDDLRQRNPMV